MPRENTSRLGACDADINRKNLAYRVHQEKLRLEREESAGSTGFREPSVTKGSKPIPLPYEDEDNCTFWTDLGLERS
jgi:hypothetical protein